MSTKRLLILSIISQLGLLLIFGVFAFFFLLQPMMQKQMALQAEVQKLQEEDKVLLEEGLTATLGMEATLNDAQRGTRLEALWQDAFDSEESYEEERLCQASGLFSASGKKVFPIHPMYGSLGRLGEIFTALRCGMSAEPRLMELGFSGESYPDGMTLFLKKSASEGLKSVLEKHAFVCVDTETCLTWRHEEPLTKTPFVDLEMYYDEIQSADCVACQVTPQE